MTRPLPAALRAPITDIASAKTWLRALVAANMTFHLEDDPEDIIEGRSKSPLFHDKDVPLIRDRVRALYALEWGPRPGMGQDYCPIGFMMAVDTFNPHNQAKGFEIGAELAAEFGDLKIIDRAACASYDYGTPGRYHLFRAGKMVQAYDTMKDARRAPEVLDYYGNLLFGPEWVTPMSRALKINDRTIRQMLSRRERVPPGLWKDLLAVCRRRAKELTDQAGEINSEADSLKHWI